MNGTSATLSCDGLDHLTKYDAGSNGQEQYLYDASGERVLRRSTSAGVTTMTVYAFGLEEHLYSGSGVLQSNGNTYYYLLGGMLVGESNGTNINMFLTDALGSVIETISATANSAAVQGNQVYSPYGSSRYQQGSMGTTKGFTGQYNDSVTGLDYYGARYYDPVVGRFLSADAVEGNGVGMDPYAYVDSNPETFTDPTGQAYINEGQLGVGIAVGTGAAGIGVFEGLMWLVCHTIANCSTPATENTKQPQVNNPNPASPLPDYTVTRGTETYTYDPQTGAITIETTFPDGRKFWQGLLPGHSGYEQALHALNIQLPGAVDSAVWAAARKQSGGSNPPGGGNGGGNGGCSFTATTQVSTDHGKQDIGKLHVGDQVLAYNPKTHKMELESILHVWINHDHDLVDLTITTTAKGHHGKLATKTSEVVHTTSEHPFFTTEQGFVAAGKVKPGMHLLGADGSVGVITGWKVVPGTQVMYNLEVANDHTFTVGSGQWVVHNTCDPTTLGNNMGGRVAGQNPHHLIPCALENHSLIQATRGRAGGMFDMDAPYNGRWLWNYRNKLNAKANLEPYHANAPKYRDRVESMLDAEYGRLLTSGTLSPDTAFDALMEIIQRLNTSIDDIGILSVIFQTPCGLY